MSKSKIVFFLHSNKNPDSSRLVDTMMSFPGIDNNCLHKSSNPYVITPQILAYCFLKINKYVSDTLSAQAQCLYVLHSFSAHTLFSYFSHCHSFHASSFTLFHFTSLPPSNPFHSLSLVSHIPPLYFPATYVAESLQQDSCDVTASFVFHKHLMFTGEIFPL